MLLILKNINFHIEFTHAKCQKILQLTSKMIFLPNLKYLTVH